MRKLFYSKLFVSFLMLLFFTPMLFAATQKGYEENKSDIPYTDKTIIAIHNFFEEKPDPDLANKDRPYQFIANELKAFYMQRNYKPVWSQEGHMLPLTDEMIELIEEINKEGLNPNNPDYHLSALRRLLDAEHDTKTIAGADILVSFGTF